MKTSAGGIFSLGCLDNGGAVVVHGDHAVDPAVGPAAEQLIDGGEVKHVELRHLGGGGEILGRHRLGFWVHNIPCSFEFSVQNKGLRVFILAWLLLTW